MKLIGTPEGRANRTRELCSTEIWEIIGFENAEYGTRIFGTMGSKAELVEAINGESDSRPPAIFTQASTTEMMERCWASWPDAHVNSDAMVTLALQPHEMYGFPTARIPFTMTTEARALGCTINPGTPSDYPVITSRPWLTDGIPSDVPDNLIPASDFLHADGISAVISSAESLSRYEDIFTVVGLCGPFDLLINLLGLESLIMMMLTEPGRYRNWASVAEKYASAYSARVSECSDSVMIIESATTDLISPKEFGKFVEEPLRRVIHAGKHAYTVLHSCGSTIELAKKLAVLGEDALLPQASSDPYGYASEVTGRVRLIGAVDPIGTMLRGETSGVIRSATACADAGFDAIAPECGLSPLTNGTNISALAHYREHNRRIGSLSETSCNFLNRLVQ